MKKSIQLTLNDEDGHHPYQPEFNETMSYLTSISLTKTLPCLAEPGKLIVTGKQDRSLAEVIPYLATLPGIIAYHPGTQTPTYRRQLLPQTNCKQCGEASCLTFAVLLIHQQRTLDECSPLYHDPAFNDRKATLEAML